MKINLQTFKILKPAAKFATKPVLSFQKKLQNTKFEKIAVNLLSDYLNFSISRKEFEDRILELEKQADIFDFEPPEWFESVLDAVLQTQTGEISSGVARYSIMQILQELKSKNQYSGIIKEDYSKYLY